MAEFVRIADKHGNSYVVNVDHIRYIQETSDGCYVHLQDLTLDVKANASQIVTMARIDPGRAL